MNRLIKHDPDFLFRKWFEENFPLRWKLWEDWEHHPLWHVEKWFPHVDVKEEKDHYLLRMDVPGMKVEDLEIIAENDVLWIKGKRDKEWEEEREGFMHAERSFGSFSRSFTLPFMDADKIKAFIEKGVLFLEVRKLHKAESHKVKITVKD